MKEENVNHVKCANATIRVNAIEIVIDLRAPEFYPAPDVFIAWAVGPESKAYDQEYRSWVDGAYRTVIRMKPLDDQAQLLMRIRRMFRDKRIGEVERQPDWIEIPWVWPELSLGKIVSSIESGSIEMYT